MTEKDKKEIIETIEKCLDKQYESLKLANKENNATKLQFLFDDLSGLFSCMRQDPKCTLEQYGVMEKLSQHALNMAKLNEYIQNAVEK